MLSLDIPDLEVWDEDAERFVTVRRRTIQLEHSLISLKKWESKHKKPFLGKDHTPEELIDYIRCMTIASDVSPVVYDSYISRSEEALREIEAYIEDPMTATTFAADQAGSRYNPSRSVVTSEIIYYWMVTFNIPFECQRWHLNSLLTLIRVCAIKNAPRKKMSRREVMERNRLLNEQRRSMSGSTG